MAVSEQDFDSLINESASPAGTGIGLRGPKQFFVDYKEGTASIAGTSIGKENRLSGDILVEGTDSVKSSFFGLPVRVHNNDGGLIPSTLFTPMPAFLMTFDPVWVELAVLAAFTAALTAIGLTDTSNFTNGN